MLLSFGKLLDNVESDNVKSIDVAGLVALMADKNSHVFVYDVDPVSDREKMGVIPGALVLSDWNKFDIATELPGGPSRLHRRLYLGRRSRGLAPSKPGDRPVGPSPSASCTMTSPWGLQRVASSDEKPCGASLNAFANLLAKVWYPMMKVSSTISAAAKCSRSRMKQSSDSSSSSRVIRSQKLSAARSRSLKCGLPRYIRMSASFSTGTPTFTPT